MQNFKESFPAFVPFGPPAQWACQLEKPVLLMFMISPAKPDADINQDGRALPDKQEHMFY